METWVQGSDKKPKFKFYDRDGETAIALSALTGYGMILYNPDDEEVGKYGTGLGTDYDDTVVSTVDAYTFQVALDKSLNEDTGVYKYRLVAAWSDTDFSDSDFDEISKLRKPLYLSEEI